MGALYSCVYVQLCSAINPTIRLVRNASPLPQFSAPEAPTHNVDRRNGEVSRPNLPRRVKPLVSQWGRPAKRRAHYHSAISPFMAMHCRKLSRCTCSVPDLVPAG
jgi:hypothetical protein